MFKLHVHTDGDAFNPARDEVVRILREVAKRLESGEDFSHYRTLLDFYGNDCGRAKLEE